MSDLTRYWITFKYPSVESEGVVVGLLQPIGFGVTALNLEIVRAEFFDPFFDKFETYYGLEDMPPVREVIENVDVSSLGDIVKDHMDPPNWRGLWYPKPGPLS